MASQDNEVESEKDKTVGQAGTVEDAVKDAQTLRLTNPPSSMTLRLMIRVPMILPSRPMMTSLPNGRL